MDVNAGQHDPHVSGPLKRGQRFEHARLIIGSPKAGTARPEVCTITRVVNNPRPRVWYQNESGMRFVAEPEKLHEYVKRWLDD